MFVILIFLVGRVSGSGVLPWKFALIYAKAGLKLTAGFEEVNISKSEYLCISVVPVAFQGVISATHPVNCWSAINTFTVGITVIPVGSRRCWLSGRCMGGKRMRIRR